MWSKALIKSFVMLILLLPACETAVSGIPSTGQTTTPFLVTGIPPTSSPAPHNQTTTPQYTEQVITVPPQQQNTPVLPAVILDESVIFLSQMAKVPSSQVQLLAMTYEVWPDTCLGMVSEGEACIQVVTPGYRLLLQTGTLEYELRTNLDGSQIRLVEEGDNDLPPGPFEPLPSPKPNTEDSASLYQNLILQQRWMNG